jgi:DNA-binding transcriptional LysR family regulator
MSFLNLDLNLLRVFNQVMVDRNLSRAAGHLAMTQPAVSNAVARLREALADTLFVRIASGVKPTPYAERIWPVVSDALQSLQANLLPDQFNAASATDTFRLAMADATAALLIPPLVQLIQAQAPQVNLRVQPLLTRDPRPLLEQDAMDLALGYFPRAVASMASSDSTDRFAHHRLYDGEYQVAMRADHPLAKGRLTLDQFCSATHMLVSFSGRPFGFVDEALAALGRRRRILITVNQFFTAGKVVIESDMLTVLPRHFVPATGYAEKMAIKPLPFVIEPVHVEMLWHLRHQRSSAQRWLRERVVQAAQQVLQTL